MKNEQQWKATKFVQRGKNWVPSPDPRMVGRGSRLIAGLQIKTYQRLLEQYASGLLIDLGCGNAPLYGIYRSKAESVVCVDWPNSAHAISYVDIEHDLNKPIPLEAAMADTIVLTDVFEHIARPALLWSEVARLLKPGGHVIVTVPFYYRLHEEPFDFHRYTSHMLRTFCADNSLEVIELEPYGGLPEIFGDLSGKVVAGIPGISQLHLALFRATISLGLVKRWSKKTGRHYPLGYSLVASKPK